MHILVTGASGKLGRVLLRQLCQSVTGRSNVIVFAPSRADLDLRDGSAITRYLQQHPPHCIVHCAAYTQVDAAEVNHDAAYTVNATATECLTRWAGQSGASILYVSTDYVFDGSKRSPYTAVDTPNPLNVYGKSKLLGEQAVQAHCPRHWILRTSWLHHGLSMLEPKTVLQQQSGLCFTQTMLKRLLMQQPVQVVTDQIGSPTSYAYLSDTMVRLVQAVATSEPQQLPTYGVYHCAESTVQSWWDVAQGVADYAFAQGWLPSPASVDKTTMAEWNARLREKGAVVAERPCYSALQDSGLLS